MAEKTSKEVIVMRLLRKSRIAVGFFVAVAALLMGPAVAYSGSHEEKQKDVVDTAVDAGSFTTLVAALQAAGLV